MSKAATIKILNQGAGVGPFNLYALDSGGDLINTIELNVPLASLLIGYNVYNLSDDTVSIKIQSNNVLCTTSQTITIAEGPVCNCITIENPNNQTILYTYTDCNGDDIDPTELGPYSAVQVCGSNPASGSSDVTIIEGDACDNGACVNGQLRIENGTTSEDGSINITTVTPDWFYSFNTPPTFPDNPQINFPVSVGSSLLGSRIKYDGPITVTLNSNAVRTCTAQLFKNNVLRQSFSVALSIGDTTVVFNSANYYTFNTTDEMYILISD